MSFVLIIPGTFLFLNGAIYALRIGMDFGVLLTLFVGLFLLLWGIFYKKIMPMTQKGLLKYLKFLVWTGIAFELILITSLCVYGVKDNVSFKEDAVIVLGAGIHGDKVSSVLKQRLDTAILYHEKNPKALIVVTGGQGSGETVTEASAMQKYLLEHGVPKNKIIKEEKATSTNENMLFTNIILEKKLGKKYRAAVITNHFHIYRGASYAKKNGILNATHMHAELKWYNIAPCYLRESLAVLKMWVLD